MRIHGALGELHLAMQPGRRRLGQLLLVHDAAGDVLVERTIGVQQAGDAALAERFRDVAQHLVVDAVGDLRPERGLVDMGIDVDDQPVLELLRRRTRPWRDSRACRCAWKSSRALRFEARFRGYSFLHPAFHPALTNRMGDFIGSGCCRLLYWDGSKLATTKQARRAARLLPVRSGKPLRQLCNLIGSAPIRSLMACALQHATRASPERVGEEQRSAASNALRQRSLQILRVSRFQTAHPVPAARLRPGHEIVSPPSRGGRSADRRTGAAAPVGPAASDAHEHASHAAGQALSAAPCVPQRKDARLSALHPWRFVAVGRASVCGIILRNPCSELLAARS